jgi:hypothetical protein
MMIAKVASAAMPTLIPTIHPAAIASNGKVE